MHIEVQVALNFVISYLYNKLPRRRVNIFGEELEKALKDKFQGHWYPEKPFKGSAFRCLKTGDPIDKVLERAARESGVPIQDILENLPAELAVWVDPGEVSYRIGEKGCVKVLFSDKAADPQDDCSSADGEVTKTFNPEAQCFRPIEAVSCGLNGLSLSPNGAAAAAAAAAMLLNGGVPQAAPTPQQLQAAAQVAAAAAGARRLPSPAGAPSPTAPGYKGSQSPAPPPPPAAAFMPRSTAPLTFTTATFAQTKFGSTKLKTSSKRANSSLPSRMSPTEFSNYIKQRAMQQQLHHPGPNHSPNSRALSPDPSAFYYPAGGAHYAPQLPPPPPPPRPLFESSTPFAGGGGGPDAYHHQAFYPPPAQPGPGAAAPQDAKLLDGGWPAYPGQYQHLLVAN